MIVNPVKPEEKMPIKQFSQTDPQWKALPLGYDKSSTIGNYGCLLTSLTMCATMYGAPDLTPVTLNDKMKAVGGFQEGTAFMIARVIGSAVPGMQVDYRSASGSAAPMDEIDTRLTMGQPVIIEVDWSPSSGLQTHYMVVYAKDGNDYAIYDPYPFPTTNGQIKLTTSKYAQIANSKDPARIITGVFFVTGNAGPVTPPTPPTLDKGVKASFPVYASADDLAIRSQALISDATLIKRFPANTQFTVLEADATAAAKVGQNNVWLPVKAADGTQGYVAAWLVSKAVNTAAPAAGTPPATVAVPSNAAVVKTNVDALKLRTKPDSTDATIMKIYPIGTELKCLEPSADVKRKVGTMYEWLSVSDVEGKQGVVAAWYVSIVSIGSYGPQAIPVPGAAHFSVDEIPPVILRATEEGLALRSIPFISKDTLICRVPKGAELIAIEAPDIAASKIGKAGEWIHVHDVKGTEGYVAAWLVKERPEDPAAESGPADC
jgi:hypothetical protein